MFQTACGLREAGGWEIQPSEFWGMTPVDWWMLYDVNVGFHVKADQDKMNRLLRLHQQAKAQEAQL